MKKTIVILFLFLFALGQAQNYIGDWQVHLPYYRGVMVSKNNDIIYCVTEGGIFRYNELDDELSNFSKVNGLSDSDVSAICSNELLKTTIIAYENSNIDIIKDNKITNIPDIKNKQIIGSKRINSILFVKNYAYLAIGFGIIKLNLDKYEISDTYYIGENGDNLVVNELAYDGVNLYAATENGIFYVKEDLNTINDYQSWEKMDFLPTANKSFFNVAKLENSLFVLGYYSDNEKIMYEIYETDTGFVYETHADEVLIKNKLKKTANDLFLLSDTVMYKFNINNSVFEPQKNVFSSPRPRDVILTHNSVYIADNLRGIVLIRDQNKYYFYPDGTHELNIEEMDIVNNELWATYGGRNALLSGKNYYGMVNKYFDNNWTHLSGTNTLDWTEIKIVPSDPKHIFIGTIGYGIIEIYDNQVKKIYDRNNFSEHTLQSIIEGNFIRIGGLAFDKNENLWITNWGVDEPISVLKKDGTWKSFKYKDAINFPYMTDIIITKTDNKWCILPRGEGLFVFNNNGTIDNENDDLLYKFQNKDRDGAILSNNINCIAEDREGIIWLGTNEGVVVYYNPDNVFDNRDYFYASQIIIEVNGEPKHLLKTELIQTIEIDGANRKWIGTEKSGLYILSPDGTSEIAHFTAENSPLLSNNVTKIKINPQNGIAYIATNKGLMSYKSPTTEANDYFDKVLVYPNPVRNTYQGDVVITGLVEDTNLKITDIAGNFVFETQSLGGQATWNGKTLQGERVKTGIYLIFLSNEDGSKTFITKLLFIN